MVQMPRSQISVTELSYSDELLGKVALPGCDLTISRGIGSGLTRRVGDPPNKFWAIGDRGPNFKLLFGIKHGLSLPDTLADVEGAKFMPALAFGPAIAELNLQDGVVTCVHSQDLCDKDGQPITGLPPANGLGEIAVNLDGTLIPPNPSGVDSEGIAAMADGTFWVADEYGPSLLHVASNGTVLVRWVPAGLGRLFDGAGYPIKESLPAIAASRQFNRGFETVALSADEKWLYVAFQSPLAHPDEATHRQGRHVRIWKMDALTGEITAQFLYPLDGADSFRRDNALGAFHGSDIKVSELVLLEPERLLILERGSATSKLYTVTLNAECAVDECHMKSETRPTLEELSAAGQVGISVPQLRKTLLLNSDDFPEIGADLEGIVALTPRTLLLVNDNDFGVEGASTRFWRVDFAADL